MERRPVSEDATPFEHREPPAHLFVSSHKGNPWRLFSSTSSLPTSRSTEHAQRGFAYFGALKIQLKLVSFDFNWQLAAIRA